jgi:hypothetical protein
LKHVEDSNKHIIEEIVSQVGYLLELNQDVRSEKYKILLCIVRRKEKCSRSCCELLMERIISRWVCVILCVCVVRQGPGRGGGSLGRKSDFD